MDNYFIKLNSISVNEHTEKKNGLTYLSWAWAWTRVKEICPDATYKIKKFGEKNLPYVYDEKTGYMCFTEVTIGDETEEMWLPVMDGANKAMKAEPYTYSTKYGEKTVEAATMFDINKTIMRCLVKNLAMFGLGLYIYAGEDLPEEEKAKVEKETLCICAKCKKVIKDAEQVGKSKAQTLEKYGKAYILCEKHLEEAMNKDET